jgi:hypothetical protein
MVLFTGIGLAWESGGMVSVVAAVQANRAEVLRIAVSVKSKKIFMTDSFRCQLTRRNVKPEETCATD